jgi:hypothetical protein
MGMKKEEYEPLSRGSIVESLTMRIQALVHLIKSDVIRAAISAKLGEIKDIKALYQLLSLAQASIENSELIENKIKGGLTFNPITAELLSELDYTEILDYFIEMGRKDVNGIEPKNNPKPKAV